MKFIECNVWSVLWVLMVRASVATVLSIYEIRHLVPSKKPYPHDVMQYIEPVLRQAIVQWMSYRLTRYLFKLFVVIINCILIWIPYGTVCQQAIFSFQATKNFRISYRYSIDYITCNVIISPVSEGSGDVMVLRRSRPPPAPRRPQWC